MGIRRWQPLGHEVDIVRFAGRYLLVRMVASYVKGSLLLFKFYLDNIWKLHQLPQWMRNPDTLQEVVEEKVAAAGDEGFTLKLPRTVARSYNSEFDRMKAELRQLHAAEKEL